MQPFEGNHEADVAPGENECDTSRLDVLFLPMLLTHGKNRSRKAELSVLSIAWLGPLVLLKFSLLPHTHNLLLILSEAQMSPLL